MSFYNQMVTFISVVEEQGFTRAANKLFITPTAVSKQIKLLEARLGQQLLARDTRSVKVTDIGERFYLHCKRISHEVDAAENFIQLQKEEPQGRLRVLCAVAFSQGFLVQRLQAFREKYPQIQLDITIDDRIPNLEQEEFDLVIGNSMLPDSDSNLRYRKLLSSYYVLCASPSYLEKYGTPKTPEDLKSHKLITHPCRQPLNLVRFEDGKEVYMEMPEVVVNNIEALLRLCIDGAGLFYAIEIHVRELIEKKLLRPILPEYPLQQRDIYLFYRAMEYEQIKVRCFIDFFVDECQKSICSFSMLRGLK